MATRTPVNISLPVELGQFIEERLTPGRNSCASEVTRAALTLHEVRRVFGAARYGPPPQ